MRLFKNRQPAKTAVAVPQTLAPANPFGMMDNYVPLAAPQMHL